MRMLLHWLFGTIAIAVAAYIVPGVSVTPVGAVIAALVLGALNLVVRPVLIVLTLPITVLTLGLFSLIVNACLALLVAYIVPGFSIAGFWSALLFAVVLAAVNWVFHAWNLR